MSGSDAPCHDSFILDIRLLIAYGFIAAYAVHFVFDSFHGHPFRSHPQPRPR
jgi:hypothetical protein